MPFQIRRKEEGEREEREKRKEKREVTAVIRKVPVDLYTGVHDDSTPHNRLHTKSAVSGNISNHLAPVVQSLNSAIIYFNIRHVVQFIPQKKSHDKETKIKLTN